MNKVITIGFTGKRRCYLNVAKEEAIARYIQSEALFQADFDAMLTSGYADIKEIEFVDEFGAYEVYEL